MALLLNTHFHLAVDSLRQNRARTFLSALGIAIGVASIVLILSLTGGINRLVSTNSNKEYANLVLVRPSTTKSVADSIIDELASTNQYIKSNLTIEDVEAISKIEGVSAASPLAISNAAITVNDKVHQGVNVVATNADLERILSLHIKNGQFLDYGLRENVAVIGYSPKEEHEAAFLSEIAACVNYFPMYQEIESLPESVRVIREKPLEIRQENGLRQVVTAENTYGFDGVFILRDSISPGQLVPGLEIENNHVKVDRTMATNLPGCFACGDVVGLPYQYIKSAGEGNVAALSAAAYLDAKKREG